MTSPAPQRIAKLLARAGVASRREIERMIEEGRIAVNGATIDKPATLLTSLHGVTVDGKAVREAAPARLFRYHKPAGLLTTERDPKGRPTIYDLLPEQDGRLTYVGRLDLDTSGLLIVTNDTPAWTRRRARRHDWPNGFRPYAARISVVSSLIRNAAWAADEVRRSYARSANWSRLLTRVVGATSRANACRTRAALPSDSASSS